MSDRDGALGPGSELDGFVIESVAGRGGMGVVYRARQREPERTVALKVIALGFADDPDFRARFKREATIAAQIEHPHVIPVYAVGQADGVLYLAMRFIDGSDMKALLARERRLEPRRAAAIVDQVAQALDVAHARGLVHRDVKPANILVSTVGGRDHAYLSDFGLSRGVESAHGLTGTGAFLGTIDYVAPEQGRGARVDARTDVYSLGCVLFHALTGTVPYPLENDLAKLYAHGALAPPSARERAPDLPERFEALLARAMAKSPDDRYPSAGDLGRAAVAAADARPATGAGAIAAGAAAAEPTVSLAQGAAQGGPANRAARRRIVVGGAAVAAIAVAAAAIVAGRGGGGSGAPPGGVITQEPMPALVVPQPGGLTDVEAQEAATPGGYRYRLLLSAVKPPRRASLATPVDYYFTLSVRHGAKPFVLVERTKVPYPFTASSRIASFSVDSNPDGTGNAALSWFVRQDDPGDVTHYFTLTPSRINID